MSPYCLLKRHFFKDPTKDTQQTTAYERNSIDPDQTAEGVLYESILFATETFVKGQQTTHSRRQHSSVTV